MTEWFNERYVPRDEHQRIVEYYRKQVTLLYRELCELRTRQDVKNINATFETGKREAERDFRMSMPNDNVIRLDSWRKN